MDKFITHMVAARIVSLLLICSGCGDSFRESTFYKSSLATELQTMLKEKGVDVRSMEEQSYLYDNNPSPKYRQVVINFKSTPDEATKIFPKIKAFVLERVAASKSKVTNPDSMEVVSPGDVASRVFDYETESAGKGRLYLELSEGTAQLILKPDRFDKIEHLVKMDRTVPDTFALIVKLMESKW